MRRFLLAVALASVGCGSPNSSEAAAKKTAAVAKTSKSKKPAAKKPVAAVPAVGKCTGADKAFALGETLRTIDRKAKEPAPRLSYRDPVFGTCITRVSDRNKDLQTKDREQGFTNEYSRVQSFNADGTKLLLRSVEAAWYLYDAKTLKPIKRLPLEGSVDPRWHVSDPDVLFYTPETDLRKLNISTGKTEQVREFKHVFPGQGVAIVSARYEGSPSDDGNRFAFIASRSDGTPVGLITYDLREEAGNSDKQTGQILGTYDLTKHVPAMGPADGGPDNISFSHTGKYVLVPFTYCERGTPLGTFEKPCGAMVFNPTLTSAKALTRTMGHEDIVLMPDGREVVVFQDTDTDHIAAVDLETAKITNLSRIDFSKGSLGVHVSGRAYKRPGWAVISVYDANGQDQKTWMDGLIFAVEVKANGRVVQIAGHRSSRDDEAGEADYFAEPHASTNVDMTRIVWTSNWGRVRTNSTEVYVAELPNGPPK